MPLFQMDPLTHFTQHCYRSALGAMSNPGALFELGFPPGFDAGDFSFRQIPLPLLAIGYTFLDEQVSLAPCGRDAEPWVDELAAATGCATASLEVADYVLCHSVPAIPEMERMKRGSLLFPEDGSTVIVWLNSGVEGDAGVLHISGPGVESNARLKVSSPMISLIRNRVSIPFEYPMGLDFLVIGSDGRLLGIPRTATTRILHDGEA